MTKFTTAHGELEHCLKHNKSMTTRKVNRLLNEMDLPLDLIKANQNLRRQNKKLRKRIKRLEDLK